MNACKWMLCVVMGLLAGNVIAEGPVLVAKPVPFADDAMIAGKIKRECDIQNQLVDTLEEYAREEQQIEVKFVSVLSIEAPGMVLDLQIKDAVSEGNPFIGHRKSTLVSGKLYRDGCTARRSGLRPDSLKQTTA